MIVFLNGQFVAEEKAVVSVFDRSFLYGDGLFETVRIYGGKPFCWSEHLERLQRGAEFLKMGLPFGAKELRDTVMQLIQRNDLPESLLRITLSRGVGPRGYSPRGANQPVLVMSLHPAPEIDTKNPPRWRLVTSSVRLPSREALAQFKTCNKLPQILARAEAEASGADEALLLNTDGEVAETASSNLFWVQQNAVCTPPLAIGILAGVTRSVVLEICQALGFPAREVGILPKALQQVDGIFVSLSSFGIMEAASLDGQPVRQSPLVVKIREAYNERVSADTGGE